MVTDSSAVPIGRQSHLTCLAGAYYAEGKILALGVGLSHDESKKAEEEAVEKEGGF